MQVITPSARTRAGLAAVAGSLGGGASRFAAGPLRLTAAAAGAEASGGRRRLRRVHGALRGDVAVDRAMHGGLAGAWGACCKRWTLQRLQAARSPHLDCQFCLLGGRRGSSLPAAAGSGGRQPCWRSGALVGGLAAASHAAVNTARVARPVVLEGRPGQG